jgi:hypothetical protein
MPSNRACTQIPFCLGIPKLGVPKFLKLGLSQFWKPITSCADLWLRWGLKKNYSFSWELFNDMWHTTCTQVNRGDSWFLVIRSQIGNLTPNLSFGHNLCFKYPNGSCKPILDIYVSRDFHWYKEIFNSMSFDPFNRLLKIGNPSGVQLPKWEPIWECVGSFPHTFLHSQEHEMWLSSFIFSLHPYKPLPWSWA